MPKVDSGYVIVTLCIIFFIVASYSILLSTFYPVKSIWVRPTILGFRWALLIVFFGGVARACRRQTLQILFHSHYPHCLLLRYSQLGRLAVL